MYTDSREPHLKENMELLQTLLAELLNKGIGSGIRILEVVLKF